MQNIYRFILNFLFFLSLANLYNCNAQSDGYIAIIPPFHSTQEFGSTESPLQLLHQRFVVFVYQNAVAVYSESDFINPSDRYLEQELALPSTGHDENGIAPGGRISNGILSIQLWVRGERVNPEFIQNGNEDWYTVHTRLAPHEKRKVSALFWAETSLTDIDSLPGLDTTTIANGKRGFLINLAHAAVWNGLIQTIEIYVILKDGILPNGEAFSAEPLNYNLKDSTLIWSMNNIEPSSNDNIEVLYESSQNSDSATNTMAKLSKFIVKHAYDQLIYYSTQLDE
jgi:hypothetical protein